MTVSTGKGRGRPRGSRNKRTLALEQAAAVFSERLEREIPGAWTGDALGYLKSVYKNPALPPQQRIDAAAKALPYERPRMAPIEYRADQAAGPVTTVLHDLTQESIDKILALVN